MYNFMKNILRHIEPMSKGGIVGFAAIGKLPGGPLRGCQLSAVKLKKSPLSSLPMEIIDNLRRSLIPASLTLLFFSSWTLLPSTLTWNASLLIVVFLPSILMAFGNLLRKPPYVLFAHHLVVVFQETRYSLSQILFTLSCLPYEAYFSMDAVLRTAWRMLVSHKNLLEWNPSENANNHLRNDFFVYIREMWFVVFWVVFSLATILAIQSFSLTVATPFLVLWAASPLIAWQVSQLVARRTIKISENQSDFLKKVARRIWAFFETFVSDDDHWLPPDNYQEHPLGIIAHRTSPTNIGLSLLSNICARDFGYITNRQFIERTALPLKTMMKMERYRGHFYNWYDTQSLDPLRPLYISSVDSGNLTGCLLILKTELMRFANQNIIDTKILEGINDTLKIIEEKSSKSFSPILDKTKNFW